MRLEDVGQQLAVQKPYCFENETVRLTIFAAVFLFSVKKLHPKFSIF